MFRRAAGREGVAAKLAGIAAHATDIGVLVVLGRPEPSPVRLNPRMQPTGRKGAGSAREPFK
jgi:hypothetical protein